MGVGGVTFPDGSVNIKEGSSQPLTAKMLLSIMSSRCVWMFFSASSLLGLIIDDEVGKQQEV